MWRSQTTPRLRFPQKESQRERLSADLQQGTILSRHF